MWTQITLWVVSAWTSGVWGKMYVAGVVYVTIICAMLLVVVVAICIRAIDHKFVRRRKVTGTVMRKYLEFEGEYGRFEVMDSPEIRAKGALFIIRVWCGRGVEFTQAVREDFFDLIKEGKQLPVEYDVGRILGNTWLVKMPVSAWEWEREIDKAIAIGQLSKQ